MNKNLICKVLNSAQEMIDFGFELGQSLPPNRVITLTGELGAGKTTLVKGIVKGATHLPPEEVVSPTFVYLNIYEAEKPVFHFDLYRLNSEDEFLSLGFEEYFHAGGLCCIEWSERISSILPGEKIEIRLFYTGPNQRRVEYEVPKS